MKVLQIDAFTDRPFSGNPAAVCILESMPEVSLMQQVACEMNLSETAFVAPDETSLNQYHIRWFTPTCEVDLCGHATLASAHALWEEGVTNTDEIRFQCKAGALRARRDEKLIVLNFPAKPAQACQPPEGLLEALGLTDFEYVGRSQYDYLVVLNDQKRVQKLKPDLGALAQVQARGVIVTAPGVEHDFVSRFFAPTVGVPEDPVTGSAHCCLAVYWSERLGKSRLLAYQASQRGGSLRVEHKGERVELAGHAVTVMRGTLFI